MNVTRWVRIPEILSKSLLSIPVQNSLTDCSFIISPRTRVCMSVCHTESTGNRGNPRMGSQGLVGRGLLGPMWEPLLHLEPMWLGSVLARVHRKHRNACYPYVAGTYTYLPHRPLNSSKPVCVFLRIPRDCLRWTHSRARSAIMWSPPAASFPRVIKAPSLPSSASSSHCYCH